MAQPGTAHGGTARHRGAAPPPGKLIRDRRLPRLCHCWRFRQGHRHTLHPRHRRRQRSATQHNAIQDNTTCLNRSTCGTVPSCDAESCRAMPTLDVPSHGVRCRAGALCKFWRRAVSRDAAWCRAAPHILARLPAVPRSAVRATPHCAVPGWAMPGQPMRTGAVPTFCGAVDCTCTAMLCRAQRWP